MVVASAIHGIVYWVAMLAPLYFLAQPGNA